MSPRAFYRACQVALEGRPYGRGHCDCVGGRQGLELDDVTHDQQSEHLAREKGHPQLLVVGCAPL